MRSALQPSKTTLLDLPSPAMGLTSPSAFTWTRTSCISPLATPMPMIKRNASPSGEAVQKRWSRRVGASTPMTIQSEPGLPTSYRAPGTPKFGSLALTLFRRCSAFTSRKAPFGLPTRTKGCFRSIESFSAHGLDRLNTAHCSNPSAARAVYVTRAFRYAVLFSFIKSSAGVLASPTSSVSAVVLYYDLSWPDDTEHFVLLAPGEVD